MAAVNFKAYCKAFDAMGSNPETRNSYANEICEGLHSNWRSAEKDVYIYVDRNTAGGIVVPEYGDVPNGRGIIRWNSLSYNQPFKNVPSEVIGYFVAGVLGAKAIPYQATNSLDPIIDPEAAAKVVFFREDQEPAIAKNLTTLTNRCLKSLAGDDCLVSDDANKVTELWNKTQIWKSEEFDGTRLRSRLELLKTRYETLKKQAETMDKWDDFMAHARADEEFLNTPATSTKEIPQKLKACRSLIKLVMIFMDGDITHQTRANVAGLRDEYRHQVTQIRTLRQKQLTATLRRAERRIDELFPRRIGLQSELHNYQRKTDVAEAILNWTEEAIETRGELSPIVDKLSGNKEDL